MKMSFDSVKIWKKTVQMFQSFPVKTEETHGMRKSELLNPQRTNVRVTFEARSSCSLCWINFCVA